MNGHNLPAAREWLRFHGVPLLQHVRIDKQRPGVLGPAGVITARNIPPDDPVENMTAQQLAVAVHERRRRGGPEG